MKQKISSIKNNNSSNYQISDSSFLHSKTFRNYFVSYLFIFMLPLIISTFIILNLFLVSSQDDAQIKHQEMVNKASEVLHQQLIMCNQTAKSSTLTTMLSKYNSEQNSYRTTILVNQVEKTTELAERVYYYIYDNRMVYTSDSSGYVSKILYRHYAGFPILLEDIVTIDIPKLYPSALMKINTIEPQNYLTYVVPLPWDSAYQNRAFIYIIPETKINELLTLAIPVDGVKTFIVKESEIIYASDDSIYSLENDVFESILNKDELPRKILGERSMVYYSHIDDSTSSLTLIMIASRNVVLADQIKLRNVFIISYLLIIILGFVLIMFFSMKNYNPIHKIAESIKSLLSSDDNSTDDISYIENTVELVIDEKHKVEDETENTNRLLKQRLINRFFNRQLSIDELEEKLSAIGYTLNNKFFHVVAINLNETYYDADQYIIDIMEGMNANNYNVLGASVMALQIVIFLVGKPNDDFDDGWIRKVLKDINSNTAIKAMASISRAYKREDMIYEAMTEMRLIVQFLSDYSIGDIVYYEDAIRNKMYQLAYPKIIQAELLKSIMLRNDKQIIDAFDELQDWTNEHSLPSFFIKSIFFSIVDEIFEMNLDFSSPKFCQNLYAVMEYSQFSDTKEVLSKFKDMKDMILIEINERNTETILLNNIISYIHSNFASQVFTISNVAETFHISTSYMRRYFKEMTGRTMHEFIDEIRLEKAINLLKQPEVQLKTISNEIGYFNYSSFIRKFKDFYNCTPGAYRRNYLLNREPS